MSTDTSTPAGRTSGASRRIGWRAAFLVAVVLALTVASPAWALPSATATLAPIGTGSYLLTLTNNGSEAIENFYAPVGEGVTSFAPSICSTKVVVGALFCGITVAPGATTQVCYSGTAAPEVRLDSAYPAAVTAAPAVASCPLAGFAPASGSGSGSGSTTGTGTTPASGVTKCVVPNVKGKTLASAEKAIVRAHCGVGKVKKARSSHVKKGRVISQGVATGKSLSGGTKVSLIVSKGK